MGRLDRGLSSQTGQEAEWADWTGGLVGRLDRRLSGQTGQEAEWADWPGG